MLFICMGSVLGARTEGRWGWKGHPEPSPKAVVAAYLSSVSLFLTTTFYFVGAEATSVGAPSTHLCLSLGVNHLVLLYLNHLQILF